MTVRRTRKSLDVLLIVDVNRVLPPDHDYFANELSQPGFKKEADVANALKTLGHGVRVFGLFDDLGALVAALKERPPDLVFNLCEAFRDRREYEPFVAGVLEMMGIPHTGVSATGLGVCKDKALAKKILSFHHIRTPRFVVSARRRPAKTLTGLRFPVFVKPLASESSEGIAQAALAVDDKSALERVTFVHQSIGSDALIEEYVDGRELYCGVLGKDRLTTLPLIELFVGDVPIGAEEAPAGGPRFFTYKAKWDESYRKKWSIRSGAPQTLDKALEERLLHTAKRACRALRLGGYARVDMRLTDAGEVFVIEVNPNPGIANDDEFAQAAERARMKYVTLIDRIVTLGLRGS